MKSRCAIRLVRTGAPAARRLAMAIATLLAAQSSPAIITHVWDAGGVLGGSSGLWSTALNWGNNSPQIFGAGDTFDLSTLNITGHSISTVDSNVTLGIIQIGDSITRSNSWTLDGTGGALITMDNGLANAEIHQTGSSFGDTLAVPLALMGGLDITNASATKVLTLSGGITSSAGSDIQTISNLGSAAGGLILSGPIGNGDTGGVIAITQNNANGSLTLAGANTFTGTTNITSGILQANSAGALGVGGDITFGGGTLQFGSTLNNATADWGARINNSSAAIRLDTNGQAVTLSGSIPATNTAGLTKAGIGTLVVSSPQSYTGTTLISDGTLKLGAPVLPSSLATGLKGQWAFETLNANDTSGNGYNGTAYGAPTYSTDTHTGAGYSLNLNGSSLVYVDTGGAGHQTVFDGGSAMTISAWIKGTPGSWAPYISKYGENAQGWQERRYGGNNNTCWTTRGPSNADMAGNSTFDSNWHMLTMTYDAAGGANNKKIYIDGALANQATATGNINASGAMMAFGARASADAYSTTNWSNFLTGKLDDIYFYNRALSAGDVSSLLTFTKATSPSLPADTPLQIASGATFDLSGTNQQVASLSDYGGGGGSVINSNTAVASTLTLNTTGSSLFSGLISGGINLNMIGAGTQVLAGANTNTGTTKITAGILQLGNNLTIQNSALDTTGAGVMNITGQTTPTFGGLTSSGAARDLAAVITTGYTGSVTALTLNPAAGSSFTYSGSIADGAAGMTLSKIGAGTQVLSGANTYTGATSISAGTLSLGNAATFTHTSAIHLSGTGRLDVNVASQSLAKLTSGVPAGTFLRYSQVQATGATGPGTILGTVELNATNVDPNYTLDFGTGSNLTNLVAAAYNVPVTLSGDASITSSTAAFAGGAGMALGASTSGIKYLTLTGSNMGANTLAGVIADGSGAIGIVKNGAGTWVLSGANTFTGGVSLGAGTLGLGSTSALGAASGTLDISGGALDSTVADLVLANPNPVALNGDFAFTGTQNLNLGTGNVTLGTAAGSARTLTVNAKTLTLGGSISDGATATGLTKSGAGTLLLTGLANYSGTTTIAGGALQAALGLPSGGFLVLDGGVLQTSGTFTKNLGTGSPAFQFTANGGGFSANGGQLTVNIGNALAEQVWGSVVGTDIVGTLQFGSSSANAGILFENGIDLNGSTRTINVTTGAGGDSAEMSGIIRTSSGSAGIIKTGTGSLTLSAVNTYNGGTTVTQGTLRAGVAGAIPAGNFVFDVAGNTALFDINGFDVTLNGLTQGSVSTTNKVVNNAVGTAKTLTVGNNDASSIFAGMLSNNTGAGGTLALTKTGAGMLTLSNTTANTYTGATTVNGGTLRLLGAGAMQGASAITVNATGTLLLDNNAASASVTTQPVTLNGGTLGYFTLSNSNILLNNNATSTVTNQPGAASFITIQAGGSGASGLFLDGGLKGSGTLTVNNATPGVGLNLRNTNTTFAGTLIVNGTASTIASMASGIGVGGNTTGLLNADITLNGTMELQNQGIGWSNTRSATQTFLMGALNGTGVMTGNSNTANDTVTVTLGSTNNNGAFSGVIANGANDTLSLVKTGAGIQTLSGANTYSGNTTLTLGTLQVGANGAIPNVSGKGNVVFSTPSNSAILDINGIDTTLNGLSQASASTTNLVVNNAVGTSKTLTVGNSNATSTFAGILADHTGAGGALALTKIGAGTLTLSGSNTYSGGTQARGGTLLWSGANNLPATGTLSVNAGGNFSLGDGTARGTSAAALNLVSGATLQFDWAAGSVDTLSTAAAVTAGNVGIIISNTSPTGTGGTLVSSPSGGLTTANNTRYFLANNTHFTAPLTVTDTAVNIGAQTPVAALTNAYWLGGLVANAPGAMALSLGATSNWASDAAGTLAGGVVPGGSAVNVIFGASGAAQQANVTTGADMNLGSITFNDAAAITLGGSNYLTLNSTSAVAATTTAALASVTPGSAISVTAFANASNTLNANLVLGASQTWNVATGRTLAVNGVVSGTNNLTIGSAGNTGTVVLAGANTYTGTTTVNAGVLKAGSVSVPNASGSFGNNSAVTLANTAGVTLDLNGYDTRIGSLAGGGGNGGNVTLNGATLTVGGNNTNTLYAGVISGAPGASGVGLHKIGTGNLQLQGTNTFTGRIVIEGGGKLIASNDNGTSNEAKLGTIPATFQADNITLRNGSHLVLYADTDGKALSANRGIYLDTGVQYIDSGGGDFFINGVISGPGSLFHSNQGSLGWNGRRLYLAGANTFSGDTWWDASGTASNYGGIDMQDPLALQNSALDMNSIASYLGARTDVNGNLHLGGLVNGNRSTADVFGTPGGLILNTYVAGVTKTYTNVVSGATMTLTKTGMGTQALNGANTYGGATSIKSGVLGINTIKNVGGVANSLGQPLLGNATIAIGDASSGATLAYTGIGDTSDRVINLAGTTGGATLDQSGSGLLTLTGNVTATGVGAKTLTLQGSTAGSGVLGGIIADSSGGATSLTKTGTGTWTLGGANTHTGSTTLNGGTLTIGNVLALQHSPLNYTTGTLAFAAGINTPTFGGLTGSTNLSVAANVTALTLNPGAGVTHTYSGTLGSLAAGMTLVKTGLGTQVLGAATYAGSTVVSQGRLSLNGSHAASAISVAGGATLGGTGTATAATATVAGAGIVEAGFNGLGSLSLGGLVFSNTGSVRVANIGNYSASAALDVIHVGGLTINGGAGSVVIALSGSAPAGGSAHLIQYAGTIGGTGAGFGAFALDTSAMGAGPRALFTLSNPAGYVDVNYSLDHPVWSGAGGGNWITETMTPVNPPTNWVLASNPLSQTNFIASDAVVFNDAVGSGTTTVNISAADVTPASVTFNNSIARSYTVQSSGGWGIAGGTSLTKGNDGTLIITTNNTYSGGTTINGGTLQVGDGGISGTLGSGSISNNGVLVFNRSNLLAMGQSISGSGAIVKNGAGELVLGGSNSHGGDTTLNSGKLTLGSATALGGTSGRLVINGGTLDSSVAGLVLTNDNAQVWNSDFHFAGSNDLNLGAGAVSLGATTGARTLTVDAATLTIGGSISNGAATALTKAGTGTLVLGGLNSQSGGTTVNAGTLTINDGASLGASTSPLAVNNPNSTGAGTDVILNLNGSVTTGPLSGTLATPVSGANTATIHIASGTIFTVDQSADGIFAGTLAGGGKLVKAGGGKLTLAGANTYSGGTTLEDGILSLGSLSDTGTSALGNSGTIRVNGGTFQYTGSDVVSSGRFSLSGGNVTFDITQSDASLTLTRSYVSSALTKKGLGTLALGGTVGWDHESQGGLALAVDEGTVLLDATASDPGFMAVIDTVDDVKTGATLKLGAGSRKFNVNAGKYFMMSGGTFDINGSANNYERQIEGTGTITNSSLTAAVLKIYPNGSNTFSGNLIDGDPGSALGLQFANLNGYGADPTAVWTLAGNNTYSGATMVGVGTLKAGSVTAFSPHSAYSVAATLDLAGFANQIAGLQGAGIVKSSSGAAVLTVNNDAATTDADFTFGGVLRDGTLAEGGGVLGLTKAGSRMLTLSGLTNTYSGPTHVAQGVLVAGSATALSPNSVFTVDGTLDLAGYRFQFPGLQGGGTVLSSTGSVVLTVNNDVATNNADNTFSGVLRDGTVEEGGGVLALTKTGSKTLTLAGINTYTGVTNVSQGTLKLAATSSNNIANSPSIHLASGAVLDVAGLSGATLALANGQTLMGSGSVNGGSVTVGSGATLAPGAGAGTLTLGGGLTLATDSVFNWDNNSANAMGNAGSDWDVASVTGGATTIASGAKLNLQFGNASTNFSDPFWDSNWTWDFITGGVSGSNLFDVGAISVFVAGTPTTIPGSQGVFSTQVSLTNLQLKWSATPDVPFEGRWDSAVSGDWNVSDNWRDSNNLNGVPGISGAGNSDTANFNGAGVGAVISLNGTSPSLKNLMFSDVIAYTIAQGSGGTLKLKSGSGTASVTVGSSGHLISAPVRLDSNTEVMVTNSGDSLEISGNLSALANQALTKDGLGTLTLSGTNSYSGSTSVNAGTLRVNGANTGSGALGVASGATLGGSGSINGATTIAGIHAPGNGGAGIQTFSNSLAYAATSRLQWQLTDNVSSGRGSSFVGVDVTGGTFAITDGAIIDLSFGAAVDFLGNFWKTSQSWRVVDLGNGLTGDGGAGLFTLGTLSGGSGSPAGTFAITRVADANGKNDVVLNYSMGNAYDLWIAAKGLTGNAALPDADPDHDGVPNSLEFVLGGEPNPASPGSNSRSLLPVISRNAGGDLLFTFHRKNLSESSAALTFQWSTDLGFPAANNVPVGAVSSATNGVDVAVSVLDADTDTIVISVPAAKAAGGKLFGRLGAALTSDGVPVGNAYNLWIATKGLAGDAALPYADPDHDGVANALEFVLGGEPNPAHTSANSNNLLPAVSQSGGNLVFTFRRKNLSEGASTLTFQWSTDLTFPSANNVPVGAASSSTGGVDVLVSSLDADTDTIVISVPVAKAAGGRLFGRLAATVP